MKQLGIEFHPESRYFVGTITYRNETRSIIEETIYQPLLRLSLRLARLAQVVQSGNVQSYLLYILVALVVLLALTR